MFADTNIIITENQTKQTTSAKETNTILKLSEVHKTLENWI